MRGSLSDLVEDCDEQPGSDVGERLFDDVARFIRADRTRRLLEHGTCVELFDDAHDRDARFGIAIHYGAMHGRGAAVLRQQRRVDVDHAEARIVSRCSGMMRPYAATIPTSGRHPRSVAATSGGLRRSGWKTGIPRSSASVLTGA